MVAERLELVVVALSLSLSLSLSVSLADRSQIWCISFFLGLVIVVFLCVSVWVCALEDDVRISLALCSRLDDGLES